MDSWITNRMNKSLPIGNHVQWFVVVVIMEQSKQKGGIYDSIPTTLISRRLLLNSNITAKMINYRIPRQHHVL